MALSDEEKLAYLKSTFCGKIESIESLAELTTFITGITPAKVRTFIRAKLQELSIETRAVRDSYDSRAGDIDAFRDEI